MVKFVTEEKCTMNQTITTSQNIDPDENFVYTAEKHGYSAEEYKITSSDGYNLILHRINGSPSHPKKHGKRVVYMQHGLWMTTTTFLYKGPNKDLVFILADSGYDVWLGNSRGNLYSRSHTTISPEEKSFWDFSYHEVAIYDVKAFIDHILKITEQEKLIFIGYSIGVMVGFALLSSIPVYNKKVSLAISLGPIGIWKHNYQVPVLMLSWGLKSFELLNNILGFHELFPRSIFHMKCIGQLVKNFHTTQSTWKQTICNLVRKFLSRFTEFDRIDSGAIPLYLKCLPAGSSARTLFHIGQNMRTGEFRAYDYGKEINKTKYGTEIPPEYPLSKVTAPVALFYCQQDPFGIKKDLEELQKMLPNVVYLHEIAYKNFNHSDILWAIDAKPLLYDPLIDLISKY